MDYFVYNGDRYNLNDIVLLKYKSRILKYIVSHISNKNNDHIIKFTSFDYDYVTKTVKFEVGKKKFIKKFISYQEPPVIKCTLLKNKYIIYKFNCDFCNTIHKHNYLGHQDCRCHYIYSPYSRTGYILELHFENFNEYLLYNFQLYLQKKLFNGWSSYKLSVKKFYDGEVCKNYGKNHFPYITFENIDYVKTHFKKDNIECSNGCLVAGLKKIIEMVLSKTILHTDLTYKKDINKLYKFYKKNNTPLQKKSQLTNNEKNSQIDTQQKKILLQKLLDTHRNNYKSIPESKKNEETLQEKTYNKEHMNIYLDLDCGTEQIETLSENNINIIKNMIHNDYPEYKNKYFYLPVDVKLYSKYFDTYEDLWLCINKIQIKNKQTIYCVDEADDYDPEFINHRLEIRKNKK